MGNPWDVKALEWISKALPNEISKLNSYSKYYQYIPYIGQAMAAVSRAGSALDSGATMYADTYKGEEYQDMPEMQRRALGTQRLFQGVQGGISGQSQDPGIYGSQGDINRDWANVAGQIGNYLPGVSKGSNGSFSIDKGSLQGAGDIGGIINNPYFNKDATDPNKESYSSGYKLGASGGGSDRLMRYLLSQAIAENGMTPEVLSALALLKGQESPVNEPVAGSTYQMPDISGTINRIPEIFKSREQTVEPVRPVSPPKRQPDRLPIEITFAPQYGEVML